MWLTGQLQSSIQSISVQLDETYYSNLCKTLILSHPNDRLSITTCIFVQGNNSSVVLLVALCFVFHIAETLTIYRSKLTFSSRIYGQYKNESSVFLGFLWAHIVCHICKCHTKWWQIKQKLPNEYVLADDFFSTQVLWEGKGLHIHLLLLYRVLRIRARSGL